MEPTIDQLRARLEAAVSCPAPSPLTVAALCGAFMEHVRRSYPSRGSMSSEHTNFREALAPMLMLYSSDLAETFGPVQLRAVRRWWEERRLCRSTVNARTRRIKQAFAWAVSMGWLHESVHKTLVTVSGLRKGRTIATEPKQVRAVPVEWIILAAKKMGPATSTMLRVQYRAGMRPGEVISIRGCEIDRRGEVWLYRPTHHKNSWRGHDRVIALGPHAIELLNGRFAPGFLFTTPSGGPYNVLSYAQALTRACERAGLPHFSPNQIRHTRLTEVRQQLGLDAAQAVGGHARLEVTQIYAEAQTHLMIEAARASG